VTSLFASGSFTNSVSNSGTIQTSAGTLPYGAFGMRVGSRFVLGFSAAPDTLMKANWTYLDPPGTGGASYGLQQNQSTILALRSAAGLGFVVNRKLSLGASFGAIYNANSLHAPYIFQSQPQLAGLKTLLDLQASGVGYNGTFGAVITPNSKLTIGLAYRMQTNVHTYGTASGNAAAQFAALGIPFQPAFTYDAEVNTKFPQAFTGGVSWLAWRHSRINLQGQWIDWSGSFHQLPVMLTNQQFRHQRISGQQFSERHGSPELAQPGDVRSWSGGSGGRGVRAAGRVFLCDRPGAFVDSDADDRGHPAEHPRYRRGLQSRALPLRLHLSGAIARYPARGTERIAGRRIQQQPGECDGAVAHAEHQDTFLASRVEYL